MDNFSLATNFLIRLRNESRSVRYRIINENELPLVADD
jgi:hypothetical protein